MRKIATLMMILPLVAACDSGQDSQWKADNRAKLNASVFPDPADRKGIFLAFPVESGGVYGSALVTWFTAEVSRAEVSSRMLSYCKRQDPDFTGIGIRKDMGPGSRTLYTGETKATYSLSYKCLK